MFELEKGLSLGGEASAEAAGMVDFALSWVLQEGAWPEHAD